MTLGAGIGLAALIIAFIGMWMPLVGLFVGWLALIIVCVAALCGDKGFTIATVILSAVAFIFFTPSLWLEAGASADATSGHGAPLLRIISIVLLAAPIGCIILFSTGKLAIKKRASSQQTTVAGPK
jgi:hypothetical protein